MTGARPRPIWILIVSDHAMVRGVLRMQIEQAAGMHVVGDASDLATAVLLAAHDHPDVVLLDLDMASSNGLDILSGLQAAVPRPRVLVVTALRDLQTHQEVIRRGALGLVVKDQIREVLLKAVRKVSAGEAWPDRVLLDYVVADSSGTTLPGEPAPRQGKIAMLSDREREVLGLVVQGLEEREIAERLLIGSDTVRYHISAICTKLDFSDRNELFLYAHRHDPPKSSG